MANTDRVLLERWTSHRDAEAFKTICDRYGPMVYATCRRVLRNRTEAEDAAQECFEVLATTGSPPKGPLGPWLHRVATYRALNRSRGENRRIQRERAYAAERAEDSSWAWDDIHDLVDQAIAKLPEKNRVAIVGHFIEGKTHAAIATEIGISRAAVTQRVHRGVEGVRKHLKRQGIPVASANLAALLEARMAEAASVPASVHLAFGRIALSGMNGVSGVGRAAGNTKAAYAGAAILVGLLAGIFFTFLNSPDEITTAKTAYDISVNEPRNTGETVSSFVAPEEESLPISEAASNAPAQVVPPEHEAAITGIVIDSVGRPVPGALVFARGGLRIPPRAEDAIAHTEDDGTFALPVLPEGAWALTAWHPDYAPGWTEVPDEPDSNDILTIEVREGGRIAGKVYMGRTPVSGQEMMIVYMGDGPGFHLITNTDAQGHYERMHLPPGTPRVSFTPPFAGNNIDKFAVVEESRTTVVDFDLGGPGVALAGNVELDNRPMAGASVNVSVLAEDGSNEEFFAKTDDAGHYAFEWLPLGDAILKVTVVDGVGGWQNYVRTFTLGAGVRNLMDVAISTEGGSLACRVAVPEGHKVFYAVVLRGEHEVGDLTLETLLNVAVYKVAELTNLFENTFLLDNLEPGIYTVYAAVADAETAWRSEDDLFANALLATEIVEVVAQEITEIDLRLRDPGLPSETLR